MKTYIKIAILLTIVSVLLSITLSRASLATIKFSPVAALTQFFPSIPQLRYAISKTIYLGRIRTEDFDKLDFTMPDDPGFGDNIEYEVFNPDSPRRIVTEDRPLLPLFPQDYIDKATTVPGTRPFFNLRRIVNKHGVSDNIVMVVPNIDLSKCNIPKTWSAQIVSIDRNIEFPSNLSKIVVDDEEIFDQCIQTKDKKGYLLIFIGQRRKSFSDGVWQPRYVGFNPNIDSPE